MGASNAICAMKVRLNKIVFWYIGKSLDLDRTSLKSIDVMIHGRVHYMFS